MSFLQTVVKFHGREKKQVTLWKTKSFGSEIISLGTSLITCHIDSGQTANHARAEDSTNLFFI